MIGSASVGASAAAAAVLGSPPSSNRGESEAPGDGSVVAEPFAQTVTIDWLTWCGELWKLLSLIGMRPDAERRALERLDRDGEGCSDLCARAFYHFFALVERGLRLDGLPGPGRFYAWRQKLADGHGKFAGCIEWGGDHTKRKSGRHTYRVELTGNGCATYECRTVHAAHRRSLWAALQAQLADGECWITRCDIACDLYDGQHTVAQALDWWESGQFDNRGQRPQAQHVSDMGSGKGSTLYLGSRQSPKLLRVYEKGKQLGDSASPWVRFECQFTSRGAAVISAAILDAPADALRAAYPVALAFVSSSASQCFRYAERAKACAVRCMRALKNTFGPALGFLRTHADSAEHLGRIVVTLTRDKAPAWTKEPLMFAEWPALLAIAINQSTEKGETLCSA